MRGAGATPWVALLLLMVVALLSGALLLLRLWRHRDITAARQHYGHHPASSDA